jgi:hypothetical protein
LPARELAVARGLPASALTSRTGGAWALFAALAFASAGSAQDYLGLPGVAAVAAVALVAGPALLALAGRVVGGWSERTTTVVAVALLVGAALAFAFVYPEVNTDATSAGSDRDEDADIATSRLLHLEYPYHARTYLGNTLTHLPGSLLFALPFVLIGWSALQNIFWLPVFYVATRRLFGDARAALLALAVVLATPAVVRELLTGGDLISNCIYVLVLTLAVLRLTPLRGTLRLGIAVALGVALSSRSNFLFVLPLLAVAVAREDGVREAIRLTAASISGFLAVTLPFYFYDPEGFTPRNTAKKLSEFNDVLPHAALVTVALATLATALLCRTQMSRSGIELCRNAALVQTLLVAMPVLLASIRAGRPDFSFLVSGYGLTIVFFAVVGARPILARATSAVTPPRGASDVPAAP